MFTIAAASSRLPVEVPARVATLPFMLILPPVSGSVIASVMLALSAVIDEASCVGVPAVTR